MLTGNHWTLLMHINQQNSWEHVMLNQIFYIEAQIYLITPKSTFVQMHMQISTQRSVRDCRVAHENILGHFSVKSDFLDPNFILKQKWVPGGQWNYRVPKSLSPLEPYAREGQKESLDSGSLHLLALWCGSVWLGQFNSLSQGPCGSQQMEQTLSRVCHSPTSLQPVQGSAPRAGAPVLINQSNWSNWISSNGCPLSMAQVLLRVINERRVQHSDLQASHLISARITHSGNTTGKFKGR